MPQDLGTLARLKQRIGSTKETDLDLDELVGKYRLEQGEDLSKTPGMMDRLSRLYSQPSASSGGSDSAAAEDTNYTPPTSGSSSSGISARTVGLGIGVGALGGAAAAAAAGVLRDTGRSNRPRVSINKNYRLPSFDESTDRARLLPYGEGVDYGKAAFRDYETGELLHPSSLASGSSSLPSLTSRGTSESLSSVSSKSGFPSLMEIKAGAADRAKQATRAVEEADRSAKVRAFGERTAAATAQALKIRSNSIPMVAPPSAVEPFKPPSNDVLPFPIRLPEKTPNAFPLQLRLPDVSSSFRAAGSHPETPTVINLPAPTSGAAGETAAAKVSVGTDGPSGAAASSAPAPVKAAPAASAKVRAPKKTPAQASFSTVQAETTSTAAEAPAVVAAEAKSAGAAATPAKKPPKTPRAKTPKPAEPAAAAPVADISDKATDPFPHMTDEHHQFVNKFVQDNTPEVLHGTYKDLLDHPETPLNSDLAGAIERSAKQQNKYWGIVEDAGQAVQKVAATVEGPVRKAASRAKGIAKKAGPVAAVALALPSLLHQFARYRQLNSDENSKQ